MGNRRIATFGIALLLVLVFASVPAVLALEADGIGRGSDSAASITYSGDDAYDPAAGGTPELSVSAESSSLVSVRAGYTFSWDHVYAGGAPWLAESAQSSSSVAARAGYIFSWDHVYAGGAPWLAESAPSSSLVAARAGYTFSWDHVYAGGAPWLAESAQSSGLVAALPAGIIGSDATSYSGDDAYDPAAGGTPEIFVAGFVFSAGSSLACALPDEEILARAAQSVDGGFSGDDPYDAAAGGTPELSLLPFAGESTLLAACEPSSFGS